MRTRDLVAIAAIVSAVATAAVGLDPTVRSAFDAPELRIALSISQGLIALVVAYLLYGRVRRRRLLNDFALVCALGLLAVGSLFFAALPSPELQESPLVFQIWAPLAVRFAAIAIIAWSALARDRRLPERIQRPGVAVVVIVDAILAVVVVGTAALSGVLPPPPSGSRPSRPAHPTCRATSCSRSPSSSWPSCAARPRSASCTAPPAGATR